MLICYFKKWIDLIEVKNVLNIFLCVKGNYKKIILYWYKGGLLLVGSGCE